MRIKRKLSTDICGTIEIFKKNVITQEQQLIKVHNIICTNFGYKFVHSSDSAGTFLTKGAHLVVGDGTTEPQFTDKALTHQLFNVTASEASNVISRDCKTITTTIIFTLPASSSFVGTLAECGLFIDSILITHSLFKDAEGNPITIEKTALDEIVITYIVSITNNTNLGVIGLANISNAPDGVKAIAGTYPSMGSIYDSNAYLYAIAEKKYLSHDDNYVYTKDTVTLSLASTHSPGSAAEQYLTFAVTRIMQDCIMNGHFLQGLLLVGAEGDKRLPLDVISLPDFDVMLQAELKDYAIGTGDGETTDFIAPIPSWLANTEKIYIDGVQQTRNVDYTCDSKHNLQNNIELQPLFNANIISGYISSTNPAYPYIRSIYISDSTDTKIVKARSSDSYNVLTGYAYKKDKGQNFENIYLTNEHPVILELADDDTLRSNEIDTIYVATYFRSKSLNPSWYDEVTLEASDDLTNWDLILDKVTDYVDTSQIPKARPLNKWAKYELPTSINKKYWRISMDMGGATQDHFLGLIFKRTGTPIKFTNAPAQNSIITMDCQIDRIWKDDKHVADVTATWEA